jgi:thymidylate synthase (FAD)
MAKTIHLLLDGTGFVELLGSFGDDLTVVNAARVSFAKESKEVTEADKKLIKYLATHGHISPFFHPQVRLRLKMPIFVAREWYRHTIGFARNEVSRRYVDTEPECFNPQELRERDPKLKQGSKANAIVENDDVANYVKTFQDSAIQTYNVLLSKGVAPEVARGILPQNMYTEFVETASLYNQVVKPLFIEPMDLSHCNWMYSILDGDIKTLHMLAIPKQRQGLRTIRDLTA